MRACAANALLLALFASAALTATGQSGTNQPQKPPAFRAGIELVTVDVNAVDKDGEPVRGLTPADFIVEVGGRRRTVARADFIDFSAAGASEADATDVTSNQAETAAPEPRAVLLLVDDESFAPSEEKAVFLTLAKLIDTLFPRDPLGFAPLSGKGNAVEFTTDRRPIADALSALVGRRPLGLATSAEMTISEAYDIVRGDSTMLARVVERQCPNARPAERDACRQSARTDAVMLANENDERATRVLSIVEHHISALASMPGTKYVLLVSEGIVIDRSPGLALDIGLRAAAAGVRLHALQVNEPMVDISRARTASVAQADSNTKFQGLDALTASAGGSVYRVTGDPTAGFERIRREMAAVYRLGLEADAADATGGERTIEVKTARPGVTIHSHRRMVLPEKHAAATVQDRLTLALQSPGIERGIALRLATFAYLGDKASAQIVASVEADADAAGLHVAYAVRDRQGKAVLAAEIGRESILLETDAPPLVVFRAAVPPGDYDVKIAVTDADGRVGTVVRPISARTPNASDAPTSGRGLGLPALKDAGRTPALSDPAIAISDVIVLPAGVEIARMRPSARIAQGSREASVYFELYAPTVPAKDVPVVLEICDSPEGPALGTTRTSVSLKEAGSPPRTGARVAFSPAALPPGHYFARVSIEGGAARSLRGFNVSTGGAAALLSDEARVLVPSFTVERFLSPDLMRALSGRLSQYGQANANAQAAARSVLDGTWRAVTSKTGEPVVDATVAGLRALAAGRPADAERLFRDALNEDPEFTVALALAGAAWASVGRDVEAARAWRTSLATGVDAPYIYPEVASALLRKADVKGLDEFLREISEPGGATPLAREAAIGAAVAGDRRRAVAALAPWVDAHPDDHEAAFLLLLALYELKTFEKDASVSAQLEARARQYIDHGGPRRALVARWLK